MSEAHTVEDLFDLNSFFTLLDNLVCALIIIDTEKRIKLVNQKALSLTGYKKEELLGKKPHEFLFALLSQEGCAFEKILAGGQCEFDALLKRKDGGEFFAHLNVTLLRLKEEKDFVVITFIDITERKELEKRLLEAAMTDHLTGLYNRRFMDEALKREKAIADRYGVPLSLILMDLDNFKTINDIYGHDIGDRVLISISNLLKEKLRKTDVSARWGGEEFLILLRNTNLPQALKVAEKLKNLICGLKVPPVEDVSASFGVVEYIKGESIDDILKRVDLALYRAKAVGKNCVISF
jgi:diguanylate cyclase (GGDEF)-like protein/PAS domain S-box-containing protein